MFFRGDKGDPFGKESHKTLPLLPLRDIVVFPHMVVPLFVGREKSIRALEEAQKKDKMIFLSSQKDAKNNHPMPTDIFDLGTVSQIIQMIKLPDNTIKVLVEGKCRGRIKEFIPHPDYFVVEVGEIKEEDALGLETEALVRSINLKFETYAKLNKKIPPELIVQISNIEDPGHLADTIASQLNLKIGDKQEVLEILDPGERLEKLYSILQSEIEILQVEKKIRNRVKQQMQKTQKEYYLNEQMRAIQKELGDKDDFRGELKELEELIAEKNMPEEVTEKVMQELKKLKMMPPMSAEATVVRNYIDWFVALPWSERTDDKMDLTEAEEILEEDHYGLKKPKERIIEYLAVQQLAGKMKGPILCFVGPPGVGKTSLGKSIARATARKFVRVSLGGVRDEAEIRGHRRTYIGAMPGKIIQSMKRAGSVNPVFLLDEVDKMSSDFRGDPSSALMEVLDPEQNNAFNDHYLDVDYNLSEVMFIATANVLHNIPGPLQDRMEIIRLEGYTEHDKLCIAKDFLVKKQLEANGLQEHNVSFSDNSILEIIRHYTREAGVRSLEREIASICRKVAKEVVKHGKDHKVSVSSKSISGYLGVQKFRHGRKDEKNEVGLANGLAWTEVGGELLSTEVTVMPGKGKLTITGKLGDVMQESAQAAVSYARSRSKKLGLKDDFYQNIDIHIHVPEGAIPKDGPSAGITMATAIISALTRVTVRNDVAMTGEITLRGRILPIGGLKEKLLAAHRGEISDVIIPKDNEKDLKEIPEKILKSLSVHLVDHMDEVVELALTDAPLLKEECEIEPPPAPPEILENKEEAPSEITARTH